jgi:hypothetical protein
MNALGAMFGVIGGTPSPAFQEAFAAVPRRSFESNDSGNSFDESDIDQLMRDRRIAIERQQQKRLATRDMVASKMAADRATQTQMFSGQMKRLALVRSPDEAANLAGELDARKRQITLQMHDLEQTKSATRLSGDLITHDRADLQLHNLLRAYHEMHALSEHAKNRASQLSQEQEIATRQPRGDLFGGLVPKTHSPAVTR